MFQKQSLILQRLASIRDLTEKHQLPVALDAIEQDCRQFVVRFPLIGGFSSGKSSLLNALIGRPVFATGVTAETAVPAELLHAEQDGFTGYFADGRTLPLSADDVRENRLEVLQPEGWVEARVNASALAALPHLRLVDMPGWDSGIAGHARAIDSYAPRSLAYGVVVSAEEGNLRESLRDALAELVLLELPIIAIISKCDKKSTEDTDAVAEAVRQEIEQTTGRPPLALVKASARYKEVDEFVQALTILEQQAETLFGQSVAARFIAELKRLAKHLDTLANRDDLNSEQIAAQIEQLRLDMQAFDAKLSAETQALDQQVAPVLANIRRRVENSLKARLETLTQKMLAGGDVNGDLATTARLAVVQGISEEFAPALQRYFERLAEAVPASLDLDITAPGIDATAIDQEKLKTWLETIATTLLTALARHPIVAIAIPILHGLAELFVDHNAQRIAAELRVESIRQELLQNLIPAAVLRIETALREQLAGQVQDAKNAIAEAMNAQRQDREAALNGLKAQLAQGQAEFAAARAQCQADLDQVQALLAELQANDN